MIVRARRATKAWPLGELKKAQEESEARERGKASVMADLERIRLDDMESPGIVFAPKGRLDKIAPPPDWSRFDADRACVECFFGRPKRMFRRQY